jgi:hypothetical protein
MFRSFAASGEGCGGASVDRGDVYSRKGDAIDSGRTLWFGLNLRALSHKLNSTLADEDIHTSGFGVVSVWMNRFRRGMWIAGAATRILHPWILGRFLEGEDVMGADCWCKHLVDILEERGTVEGAARTRRFRTDRDIVEFDISNTQGERLR